MQGQHGDCAAVDDLAQVAEDEQRDHPEDGRWDTEQVGLGRVVSEVTKRQCQVCLRWVHGD